MMRHGAGDTTRLHEPDAALLRTVVDSIPARVTIVGNDHRYIYVNREFLDFVRLDAVEVVGRLVSEILGEEAYRTLAPLRARVQAGETVHREGWLGYRGGEPRFVQQIFTPYRAGSQAIEGYLVFARDLTELKLRERELANQVTALEASRASNAAVIASSLDCIVVIDEVGLVIEFNPAAEKTFGYLKKEAVGQHIADLIIPEGLRERHSAGMRRYLESGVPQVLGQRLELEAKRACGEVFPVELTITELRLHDQRLFAAHLRDLTTERAAREEIEAHRLRLHQVEKLSAMGSLLAGVAHELNNPLAVVLAQASLLQAKAGTDDLRARADKIHAAASRAGRIIKSFLAMARQRPPRREHAQLNEIVVGAVEMTAYGRRSVGIDLELDLDQSLPALEVDSDMLGQVVANLLVNAAQVLADTAGPRRIAVTTKGVPSAAILEISDNGPGVPPEIAPRIFEPYFTTKAIGAGTGIGLTISRNIVEAHCGTIELSERPGGGASFKVTLPRSDARSLADTGKPAIEIGGLSVLVVDDEMDLAESLAQILETFGHKPLIVSSGEEALALIASRGPDVVFADLRMPGVGGLDLHRGLRQSHPGLADRLVVMTGDVLAGPESIFSQIGPDAIILEKPFSVEDVEAVLSRVAERTSRRNVTDD